MRFGVSIPNFGPYSDPGLVTELATAAEESGWHGFFVWDHIVVGDGVPVADPWVILGAAAAVTDRILLGPMVTPIPRRRPWVVARQATTLDHLSDGRLVLGVGLGSPAAEEFGTFGEPTEDHIRAEKLDEGLEILRGMWSARPFEFRGRHFRVSHMTFAPSPRSHPSIPIWVAASWGLRKPMRRAACFDGVFPVKWDMTEWVRSEVSELCDVMREERGDLQGFDVVIGGSFASVRDNADAHSSAGATWLLALPGFDDTPDDLYGSISDGPG